MTELEELERKTGRLFTIDDRRRVDSTKPLSLTELDFALIEHFDGPKHEAAAREAQRQAQLDLVHAHMPPVTTKSLVEPLSSDERMRRASVTRGDVLDHLVPALKKMKDATDARVRSLEQRNTELEARVLELEASLAARSKVEV